MIALLNSPVIPVPGVFDARHIRPCDAAALVKRRGFISFVGHESVAIRLSELLGLHVPVCREPWKPQPGDTAIAMRSRLPREMRGRELSIDEQRRLGFELWRIEYLY